MRILPAEGAVKFCCILLLCGAALSAQTPGPKPAADGGAQPGGRFEGLSSTVEVLRQAYEKAAKENIAQIDAMVKAKRCRAARVDTLMGQVENALDLWNKAAVQYWTALSHSEELRVESQQKSLADMEADQNEADDLVISRREAREKLMQHREELLQKGGKSGEDIGKDMDSLIVDIRDSESRLAEAEKNFDEVSTKVRTMQATINKDLVTYRQNRLEVERYGADMREAFKQKRAEVADACK